MGFATVRLSRTLLLSIIGLLSVAFVAHAADDWPTYMHDFERTGITSAEVKLPLHLQWTHVARHAPQPAWPPPAKQNFWGKKFNLKPRVIYDRAFHVVASNGLVYFGSSAEDTVTCLDLKTGETKWRFFAEGPVRFSPAIHNGRAYFGSDDSYVYCVDAASGKLVWKHLDAPQDLRIPGNGRMISTWPIRSDVMIHANVARFTAGLFPKQGAHQVAIDTTTGKPIARAALNFSPQGYLEQRGQRVYFASGRAGLAYFAQLERRGLSPPKAKDEKKDKTAPRPSTVVGTPTLRFVGGLNQVDAREAKTGKPLWSAKVDGQVYSLAIAGGCLLASTDKGRIYCFGTDKPASSKTIESKPGEFAFDNAAQKELYMSAAAKILEHAKLTDRQGYCLVLGTENGVLAYEIARQSMLRVVCVESDAAKADAARRTLASAGVYGKRVAVHHVDYDKLPYGDWLFNLIISDTALATSKIPGNAVEVMRVLRPGGGVLCIGLTKESNPDTLKTWLGEHAKRTNITTDKGTWATYRSEPLPGAGEWTHLYGDTANRMTSHDEHVGSSLAMQWFGRPGPRLMIDRHLRTMSPLSKAGRLFVPGNDHLFAVDAYNGAPLWDRPMPNFRRVSIGRDTGMLAATDDALYAADATHCHKIDPDTGKTLHKFAPPAAADGKPRDWGYVAIVDDVLVGTATKPGAARRTLNRGVILQGYTDRNEIVTSDYIFCFDRKTGESRWPAGRVAKAKGAIVNPTFTVGDGKLYFIASTDPKTLEKANGRVTLEKLFAGGAELIAMDLASGSIVWRRKLDLGKVQHDVYLAHVGGRLVLNGTGNALGPPNNKGKPTQKLNYYFWAFDAGTGRDIWQRTEHMPLKVNGDHGEQNRRPVLMNRNVYLPPWAFKLDTGEPLADWKTSAKRRGCGAVTASASTFFFRDATCSLLDIETRRGGKVTTSTRPGCWINMIPAAGLLLIPEASSGCTCKHPVQTSMAFRPKKKSE